MKIIVAEDDPLSLEIIVKILKNLGHDVRAFPCGAQAWTSFQEEWADVIFSDWVMPGMSISFWQPGAGPATPTTMPPCAPGWMTF